MLCPPFNRRFVPNTRSDERYSITPSARSRGEGGTTTPSAWDTIFT
jgi:hypothetical protein